MEAKALFLGIATKYAASGSSCLSPESYHSCQAALSIQEPSLVLVVTWLPIQERGDQLTSYYIAFSPLVSLDFFITLLTVWVFMISCLKTDEHNTIIQVYLLFPFCYTLLENVTVIYLQTKMSWNISSPLKTNSTIHVSFYLSICGCLNRISSWLLHNDSQTPEIHSRKNLRLFEH